MKVLFVAGFGPIVSDRQESAAFYREMCWLLLISARFIRHLRALSYASLTLPIPRNKSTIETLSSAHFQKG